MRRVSNVKCGIHSIHTNSRVASGDESSTYAPPLASCLKRSTPCTARAKHHPHIVTRHDYHDHAADPLEIGGSYDNLIRLKGGQSTAAFPVKLYEMLVQVDKEGLSHIISWQPHGRCFVVHSANAFKKLVHRFFKQSKIASFQRQLNLYGFQRLTAGQDKGAYYHELFLRNRADLLPRIQRVKVKGTGVRAKSNPKQEPDLYLYPTMAGHSASIASVVVTDPVGSLLPETDMQSMTLQPPPRVDIEPMCSLTFSDGRALVCGVDPAESAESEGLSASRSNPMLTIRGLSLVGSLNDIPQTISFRNFPSNAPSTLTEEVPMILDEGAWDMSMIAEEEMISFDLLIDEMFCHDENLEFSDILEMASVSG